MQQGSSHREPIFNAPRIVVVLLGSFVALHIARNLLSAQDDALLMLSLAFIPARYGALMDQLPGGTFAALFSWLSHAFVHGDVFHLAINSAWMLAFGSAMARRLGVARFLAFSAVCTIAAAAAFMVSNWGLLAPMVGASGAIAGLMGGTMRFLFSALGGPNPQDLHNNIRAVPRMALADALRDKRLVLVTLGWVVINVAFGYGASALTSAGGIAWEAHLGGYFAGLLLFGLFDPGRATPYDDLDYLPRQDLPLDHGSGGKRDDPQR